MILLGKVVAGLGHLREHIARHPHAFVNATGEVLVAGTLNVDVGRVVPIREDFRIRGEAIEEPGQDLLFEACLVNGIPAYRVQLINQETDPSEHDSRVLQIACSQIIIHKGWVEIELNGIER